MKKSIWRYRKVIKILICYCSILTRRRQGYQSCCNFAIFDREYGVETVLRVTMLLLLLFLFLFVNKVLKVLLWLALIFWKTFLVFWIDLPWFLSIFFDLIWFLLIFLSQFDFFWSQFDIFYLNLMSLKSFAFFELIWS